VHADHTIADHDTALRATLCRCGQSRRKPYCDGSHSAAGFTASGEPATGSFEPLAARDGRLAITPLRNGPLRVQGNLELLAGTGRTVAKLGAPNAPDTRLCRCGHSKTKPFCDGSHIAAGFVAEGLS
jgi:CDGSH-type Zn-finger protein